MLLDIDDGMTLGFVNDTIIPWHRKFGDSKNFINLPVGLKSINKKKPSRYPVQVYIHTDPLTGVVTKVTVKKD